MNCARCGADSAEWRPFYHKDLCDNCFHDCTIIDQASDSLRGLLDRGYTISDIREALEGTR